MDGHGHIVTELIGVVLGDGNEYAQLMHVRDGEEFGGIRPRAGVSTAGIHIGAHIGEAGSHDPVKRRHHPLERLERGIPGDVLLGGFLFSLACGRAGYLDIDRLFRYRGRARKRLPAGRRADRELIVRLRNIQRRLRRGVFCIKSWRCNGCQELAFFDPSPIVLIPTAHVAGDLAENSRLVPGLDCPWQDECARCGPVLRRDDLYRQRGLIIGDVL